VIFANSVLGARTNKNGAIIDLLCAIVGKTPLAGLLTDEGRRASWLVEVNTAALPSPQLLGAAIGQQALAGVPFIVGLDRFLDPELDATTRDYLHEMGAACATAGAVSLFHVENITPEAVDDGRDLLTPGYRTFSLDDQFLQDTFAAYPVMWEDADASPEKCFIGCPHLSLEQLYWWTQEIDAALRSEGRQVLPVRTTLCAAPQVIQEFKSDTVARDKLERAGVKLSTGCPMQLFDNDLSAGEAIVTNSNKLQAYTAARFFPDGTLVEIMACGEIVGRN
jgi:predicted aconitase